MNNQKLKFWNERSQIKDVGGTDDFILQKLEEKIILELISDKVQSVLDIGCGDGHLLEILNEHLKCKVSGIDFTEGFIRLCKETYPDKNFEFKQGSMLDIDTHFPEHFDAIFTKRSLINLDSFEEQSVMFDKIISHLNPGGHFYMIECTLEGLDRLNRLRKIYNLELMEPPWHNRFFKESEIKELSTKEGSKLIATHEFASTYYLLSRVVYAKIAKDNGEKLRYDSPINMTALDLPSFGDLGGVRLFVFQRN